MASSSQPDGKDKDGKDKDGKDREKEGDGEDQLSDLFAARREEEIARRDRSLAEFLVMLDGYKPLVSLEVGPRWDVEGTREGGSRMATDARFRKRSLSTISSVPDSSVRTLGCEWNLTCGDTYQVGRSGAMV